MADADAAMAAEVEATYGVNVGTIAQLQDAEGLSPEQQDQLRGARRAVMDANISANGDRFGLYSAANTMANYANVAEQMQAQRQLTSMVYGTREAQAALGRMRSASGNRESWSRFTNSSDWSTLASFMDWDAATAEMYKSFDHAGAAIQQVQTRFANYGTDFADALKSAYSVTSLSDLPAEIQALLTNLGV